MNHQQGNLVGQMVAGTTYGRGLKITKMEEEATMLIRLCGVPQ